MEAGRPPPSPAPSCLPGVVKQTQELQTGSRGVGNSPAFTPGVANEGYLRTVKHAD